MDDDDDLLGALPLMIGSDLELGFAHAPSLEHHVGVNGSTEEEQNAHRAWAEAVISQKLDDGQVVDGSDDLMEGPADDGLDNDNDNDNDNDDDADLQLLQQLQQELRREDHQEIPEQDLQEDFHEIPEHDHHEVPDEISHEILDEDPREILDQDPHEILHENHQDSDSHLPSRFEIAIPNVPEEVLDEYEEIYSSIVEKVFGSRSSGPRGRLYQVEFTDGREDMLSLNQVLKLRNGKRCLYDYKERRDLATSRRERKLSEDEWDSNMENGVSDPMDLDDDRINEIDNSGDDDEDVLIRRSTALKTRTLRSRETRSRRSLDRDSDGSNDLEESPPSVRPSRNLRTREPKQLLLSEMDLLKNSIRTSDGEQDDLALDAGKPVEEDDDELDVDFRLVTSDIAVKKKHAGRKKLKSKSKRLQQGRGAGSRAARKDDDDSEIEFEQPRRSNRANKNTSNMDEYMDDDSLYIVDDRSPVMPKVVSIREVFPPISAESSFGSSHMQYCQTCNNFKKGDQLLYCQGCSSSFHRNCIGYRSGREHQATKVGDDNFVLQCRYCIGVHKKRDENAPSYSMCQECKEHGPSCAPFSPKKTSRQEEKIREENGGVDPVTQVPAELINNANNVLFRCTTCYRAWHQDHIPWTRLESIETDIKENRPKKHSRDWRCEDCNSTEHKMHRLVAWRPVKKTNSEVIDSTAYDDFTEDWKQYLVKWQELSHAHCTWMPGAWIYGVAASGMRNAFAKHATQSELLKLTTKEAIPDEFLMPDIIFNVKMAAHVPKGRSRHEDLANVSSVAKILVKFQGLGYDDVVWDSAPTPENPDMYNSFVEAYREYLAGKYFRTEPYRRIRDRATAYKNEDFVELDFQPEGLKRGKLMGYQMEGLNWLLQNYHHGRNVVLADEMGLGKTVQVIALVTSLVLDKPKCWPFLIVVPNSTCPNWRREFKQWAPDIRVVTYHGGKESQDLAYKYELFPNESAEMRAQVVIMSYDSAADQRTQSLFKSVNWAGLVVDEGQRLKNEQSLLYLALRAMKIPFRLLLTGTPLQNNKRELFNLLQFIDESQKAAKLDEQFEVLDKETLPQLHDKIRPYFLRRTKAGVLKFLPPMAQIILPVTMTVIQQKLSKSIMAKNPQLIKAVFANSKMGQKERGSLNNILMQLRKCLCHPFMYSDAIEERHQDSSIVHRNLVEASAKLLLLELMLPKLRERGHRVLIFSQFLQQLDIIEDFLVGIGFDFRRLDGSISSLEKQRRIDAFNEPGSEVFAFLLSTRAGGVGINLATADTVIIMDPDFNPHQDMQALSRAHRIGQKNKVLCFQLVTKDSVEEQIMQVGRKKMALDHALIESMDDDELAGDDLESILKRGAQALFDENYEKAAIHYDSASVDQLLDRSQVEQTATNDEGSAETQFTYARVWSNNKLGFEENQDLGEEQAPEPINSSVWDQILAEREEEARREAEANKEVLGRGARRRNAINYTANAAEQAGEAQNSSNSDSSDEFSNESQNESEDEEEEPAAEIREQPPLPPLPPPAPIAPVRPQPTAAMPQPTRPDVIAVFAPTKRRGRPPRARHILDSLPPPMRDQAGAPQPPPARAAESWVRFAAPTTTPPQYGSRIAIQPPVARPYQQGQQSDAGERAGMTTGPPPNTAPVPASWAGGAQGAAGQYPPNPNSHGAPGHKDAESLAVSRQEIRLRLAMDKLKRTQMPEAEKRPLMEKLQRQVWELNNKRGTRQS